MRCFWSGVFCCFLFLTSCYFPGDVPPVVDHYPLTAGNSWHYIRTITLYNFRPPSLADSLPYTGVTFTTDVVMQGEVSLNDGPAFTCQTIEHENGRDIVGYDYYRQVNESLRIIAYTGGSVPIYPQQSLGAQLRFGYGGIFSSSLPELMDRLKGGSQSPQGTGGDSLIYEQGPVTSFIFPINIGREWDYRVPQYSPGWRMHKKVMEVTPVTVANSRFETYKIRWYWDMNNSGFWDTNMVAYDYLSSSGVLQREFIIKNLVIITSSTSNLAGFCDSRESYVAQSMTVH